MSWRPLLGWLLLVAAVASGWSIWHMREKFENHNTSSSDVDYVLHDFELVALDADNGHESVTLRAPLMQRYRSNQQARITTPLFLLPDKDSNHWTLRSKVGWLSPKGDELRLRDQVEGDSPTSGNEPTTTFRTSALDIYPKQNQAKTTELVTMTRPGLRQDGTGFELDLDSRNYQLLSKVRTRYEPNAAKNAAN